MIKLLIVDDEPLVQAGIKSMINWNELNISVVGVAGNGLTAYQMIIEYGVELVITDIKMPVMGGLELARKCYDEGRSLPVFIILTSYEDFCLVKEAISYQVVDYLIKLELTPDVLKKSLQRAIDKISSLRRISKNEELIPENIFREQFFIKLLFNLFESEKQFLAQAKNLHIDFSYDAFAVGYIEFISRKASGMTMENQISLYASSGSWD